MTTKTIVLYVQAISKVSFLTKGSIEMSMSSLVVPSGSQHVFILEFSLVSKNNMQKDLSVTGEVSKEG